MLLSINMIFSFQQNNVEVSFIINMIKEDRLFKGLKRVINHYMQAKDKTSKKEKTMSAIIEYIEIKIGLYYILSITVNNKRYKVNKLINLGKNKKNKTIIFESNYSLLNSSLILYHNIRAENMPNNKLFLLEEQFKKVYQLIKEKVIKNKYPVSSPIAITLGGQPGAGKRNIYKMARKRFSLNIVELNCDSWRIYHPYYKELHKIFGKDDALKTNPFVFLIVDLLIEELSNEKYNLIIESSLNSPYSALENGTKLPPKGYKVELQIMATYKQISWQGTIDRYNNELKKGGAPRVVSKKFHDLVVNNICSSLAIVKESKLMSNILIYNRNKDCIYNMKKDTYLNPCFLLSYLINGDFSDKNKLAQFMDFLKKEEICYNQPKSVANAIIKFNNLFKNNG